MSSLPTPPHSRTWPLIAVLAAAATGFACPSGESALAVEEFQSLTLTAASASAPGTCGPSGTSESFGVIDVTRGECCGYAAGVELVNDLPSQTDSQTPPLTVDQHDVTISSVTASYEFIPDKGSPNVVLKEENLPVTAVLSSGAGTASLVTPILSLSNGQLLNPAGGTPATGGIVATLVYNGTTRDGTAIASSPITFPITVCSGCLPVLNCTMGVQVCTPDSSDQGDGAICLQ